MDIDSMEAGPEMDALVEEQVFGGSLIRYASGRITRYLAPREEPIPAYSTDIAAAWQVVEELMLGDWFVMTTAFIDEHTYQKDYRVGIDHSYQDYIGYCEFDAHGATMPEAICRAALKVVAKGD